MYRDNKLNKAIYRVVERFDGSTFEQIAAIRRVAMRLQRYAEIQCNGIPRYDSQARQVVATWTDADDARYARLTYKAMCEVQGIAAKFGATSYHQSDPRGLQVYLYSPNDLPEGRSIESLYPQIGTGVPQTI